MPLVSDTHATQRMSPELRISANRALHLTGVVAHSGPPSLPSGIQVERETLEGAIPAS